jgi:hypothetical protein
MSRAKPLPKNITSGTWVEVKRIDAASAQLDTAIHLYFTTDDKISIHTLLYAVIGILNPILKAKGGPDLLLADRINPEYRDSWLALVKEGANFFKHGKPNPEEKVLFRPDWNELTMCAGVEGYRQIKGSITENMQIVTWWMKRTYPNLFLNPVSETEKELFSRFKTDEKAAFYRYLKFILGPESRA